MYADHLDETGDPDRAEFIRLQVALARGEAAAGGRVREKVLRHAFADRWLAPLRRPGGPLHNHRTHAVFRRGFVDAVWMPAAWFLAHADRLFAACPVTELRVIFADVVEFSRLAGCHHLRRLRALDVCDQRFGAGGVACLIRSPHLPHLRHLLLPGCNIDHTGAELLWASGWTLELLDLRHNPLPPASRSLLHHRFGDAVRF